MKDFFEKALALQKKYYEQAIIKRDNCVKVTGISPNSINVYKDDKIEILAQIVSIYVTYGGNLPSEFSISLQKCFYTGPFQEMLKEIISDLGINSEVTVNPKVGYSDIYNYDVVLNIFIK